MWLWKKLSERCTKFQSPGWALSNSLCFVMMAPPMKDSEALTEWGPSSDVCCSAGSAAQPFKNTANVDLVLVKSAGVFISREWWWAEQWKPPSNETGRSQKLGLRWVQGIKNEKDNAVGCNLFESWKRIQGWNLLEQKTCSAHRPENN